MRSPADSLTSRNLAALECCHRCRWQCLCYILATEPDAPALLPMPLLLSNQSILLHLIWHSSIAIPWHTVLPLYPSHARCHLGAWCGTCWHCNLCCNLTALLWYKARHKSWSHQSYAIKCSLPAPGSAAAGPAGRLHRPLCQAPRSQPAVGWAGCRVAGWTVAAPACRCAGTVDCRWAAPTMHASCAQLCRRGYPVLGLPCSKPTLLPLASMDCSSAAHSGAAVAREAARLVAWDRSRGVSSCGWAAG